MKAKGPSFEDRKLRSQNSENKLSRLLVQGRVCKSDYTCPIYKSILHCRGIWPTGWIYFCHNSHYNATTIHQPSQNWCRQRSFSQKVRSDDADVKSDYFLHVHMWRSSLSTITVCRFWQKQYVKTLRHCSFFPLKARQSERGRLKIYSWLKNLWDSPESCLRLYASVCGESVNAKLQTYTFKQYQGNTASHGPFNVLRVRSVTFTKQQPAWMIEMEIFTLAGWYTPTVLSLVRKMDRNGVLSCKLFP